jgi:hypothetical protein
METLFKDFASASWTIEASRLTAIVIVTPALGIGASTAIFSVVNGVLLRQPPYQQSDRIVAIHELECRR